MELEELKNMWQEYDSKLNNLEKMNRKLLMETLSQKPKRRINYMRFQNTYGIIIAPLVLAVVFYPYIKPENINMPFIAGWIFILAAVIFGIYNNLRRLKAVKVINIENDTVSSSLKKTTDLQAIYHTTQLYTYVCVPVMFAGILMILWKNLTLNTSTILFMIGLLGFTLFYGIKQFKNQINRIEKLKKELNDLDIYLKE
jgi:hypothetical protein